MNWRCVPVPTTVAGQRIFGRWYGRPPDFWLRVGNFLEYWQYRELSERFAEREIQAKVGSDAETVEKAAHILGNANPQKQYRREPSGRIKMSTSTGHWVSYAASANSPMPHAKHYMSHNLRLQRTIPCVGGASRQMIG
jgi:hypothetical protein